MQPKSTNDAFERYRTPPQAASELGIKIHALRRAINRHDVPVYYPFGKRRYVLLSEINAVIAASKIGGAS